MTGGGGQICYSLLFRIASGELFGKNTLVDLVVLEREEVLSSAKGVEMELHDCAYDTLGSVKLCSDPNEGFEGVDYAILVGAKPRGKGEERRDVLKANAKIFFDQGKALDRSNKAKVLVVGNPCNTNALILHHNSKVLPAENIRCMSRLDQNRATAFIAEKAGVDISKVRNVGIFGNHSPTMVTDYLRATIDGKKAVDVIKELNFFQSTLFTNVAQRGTAIINARNASSAASAANAALDAMKDWIDPMPNKIYSAGIYSNGNPYNIADDLFFSFPLMNGEVVKGLSFDSFLEEKIKATEKELLDERDAVKKFLI